jgi:thiol-disulfide isomerase/thioredoxin
MSKTINNIIQSVQQTFKKISTFHLLLVVGLIFIIVVVFSLFFNKKNRQGQEGLDNPSSKQAELLFFSVDWCPHCKTAKPEWDSVKQDYQGKTVNGYTLVFTDINCTDENADIERLMNKYNIEGFPTIKLLKDGQVIEFDAKPTKNSLEQFINTVVV